MQNYVKNAEIRNFVIFQTAITNKIKTLKLNGKLKSRHLRPATPILLLSKNIFFESYSLFKNRTIKLP